MRQLGGGALKTRKELEDGVTLVLLEFCCPVLRLRVLPFVQGFSSPDCFKDLCVFWLV